MDQRLPSRRRATRNGARFAVICALDHSHRRLESQTVPNLLVKIELSGVLVLQERGGVLSATSRVKFRTHAKNYAIPNDNLVPRDQACYTCHTDYTMYGDVNSKTRHCFTPLSAMCSFQSAVLSQNRSQIIPPIAFLSSPPH